jgi:hypothetical protein
MVNSKDPSIGISPDISSTSSTSTTTSTSEITEATEERAASIDLITVMKSGHISESNMTAAKRNRQIPSNADGINKSPFASIIVLPKSCFHGSSSILINNVSNSCKFLSTFP